MVKLRGPKYISELISYQCPFTEKTLLLHPTKWPLYLQKEAQKYTAAELSLFYRQQTNTLTKKILEDIMIYYHNSVVQ